jgi:hypothetical protein
MRIVNIYAISILMMGVSSWLFTNLWPFSSNKLPAGWNPINGLPPCGPEGPAHPSPSDVLSLSSRSSPEGTSTTSVPITMVEPSPSGLADIFGSMKLSPSPSNQATANTQVSSQAQQLVAATSILAESVLPINPASSQILQPYPTLVEANFASSQVQQVVPVASSNEGPPPAWSQVQDVSPAASTGGANPIASSQAQGFIPAMSTEIEDIGPGSSQAQNILPATSTFAEMLSPQGSSLVQEALASASGPGLVIPLSASLVPGVIPSFTTVVTDAGSSNPSLVVNEALPSIQVFASDVPPTSLDPLASQGQANDIVPTTASNGIFAVQTSGIPQETTQTAYAKGNITQSPLYQNQTMLSHNATAASNGSSHNATITSAGSTDTPKSLVSEHEVPSSIVEKKQ